MRHHFDLELDLHGCRVEEALTRIKNVIYRSRGKSILIIHGKGSGALKKAVREYVNSNPCVRECLPGEEMNFPGGDGVIVIYT